MKTLLTTVLVLMTAITAAAQVEVVSIEKLDLGTDQEWAHPRFAPDGQSLFLTNTEFDGIWQYSPGAKQLRQLTDDPKSGYGFAVSADGRSIAYRRTLTNDRTFERTQELVLMRVDDGASEVVASSRRISLPVFTENTLRYAEEPQKQTLQKSSAAPGVYLLGLEQTKIAVSIDGVKSLLDPLGKGRYIWPSLSPDGTRIVAYAMEGGSFVYDLRNKSVTMLGRRNAGVWTRTGNWIVYMEDRDDGHRILSSDILCVSPSGDRVVPLTATPEILEMYPQCSPVDDRITFHTLGGEVYVLTYREVTP